VTRARFIAQQRSRCPAGFFMREQTRGSSFLHGFLLPRLRILGEM
jgi:hypothetical protein